jgi:hypothetical protein
MILGHHRSFTGEFVVTPLLVPGPRSPDGEGSRYRRENCLRRRGAVTSTNRSIGRHEGRGPGVSFGRGGSLEDRVPPDVHAVVLLRWNVACLAVDSEVGRQVPLRVLRQVGGCAQGRGSGMRHPEREYRRDEYRRGQAPPVSQRKSLVFMAWFPRDRGCGRVRAVTNPDTPCRPYFERGAAALRTG